MQISSHLLWTSGIPWVSAPGTRSEICAPLPDHPPQKKIKIVETKQINVIFKSEKKKKRSLVRFGTKLYTLFMNYFELLYDLLQKYAKWLVYIFSYQVDFSAPPKVTPGVRVPPPLRPLPPLRYATALD